jgi:hypothetical protein
MIRGALSRGVGDAVVATRPLALKIVGRYLMREYYDTQTRTP